jgi:hypothetical protein
MTTVKINVDKVSLKVLFKTMAKMNSNMNETSFVHSRGRRGSAHVRQRCAGPTAAPCGAHGSAMLGPHLRSLAHFPLPPRAILLRASAEGSLVTVPLNISEGFLNCCCSLHSWPTALYEPCVSCTAFIGLERPPFPSEYASDGSQASQRHLWAGLGPSQPDNYHPHRAEHRLNQSNSDSILCSASPSLAKSPLPSPRRPSKLKLGENH